MKNNSIILSIIFASYFLIQQVVSQKITADDIDSILKKQTKDISKTIVLERPQQEDHSDKFILPQEIQLYNYTLDPKIYQSDIKLLTGDKKKFKQNCGLTQRKIGLEQVFFERATTRKYYSMITLEDEQKIFGLSLSNINTKDSDGDSLSIQQANLTQFTFTEQNNDENEIIIEDDQTEDLDLRNNQVVLNALGTNDDTEVLEYFRNVHLVAQIKQSIIYIVSEKHLFFINISENREDFINSEVKISKNFKQRDEIHMVRIQNNLIFVSAGEEGLDIYKIKKGGDVEFFTTIDQSAFEGEDSIDIQDLRYYDKTLMVLRKKGLYFFHQSPQDLKKFDLDKNFYIPQLNSLFFTHQDKTTFLIAYERDDYIMQDNGNFVVEIIIDWGDGSEQPRYFVNRILKYVGDINEMRITIDMGLMVSESELIILYHSQYSEFVPTATVGQEEIARYIQRDPVDHLKYINVFHRRGVDTTNCYITGLVDRGFRLFKLTTYPSTFYCKLDNMEDTDKFTFQIQAQKTEGIQNLDRIENIEVEYLMTLNFEYQSQTGKTLNNQDEGEQKEEGMNILNIFLIVGLSICGIILLTVLILQIGVRARHKMKKMEEEINKLQQYKVKYEQLTQE